MSERLLQVDLLDAQARSSRMSMLLPGSLLLAETELRCRWDAWAAVYCLIIQWLRRRAPSTSSIFRFRAVLSDTAKPKGGACWSACTTCSWTLIPYTTQDNTPR